MDDRLLVQALLAGDREAPRRFVEQYQHRVFGLCLRMMSHRQDAEDVAQDAFVRALGALGGFDLDRPVLPWLLGIAANRCRTALSQRARRPQAVGSAEPLDGVIDPRPEPTDLDDLALELRRATDRLRPEYRLVFHLYHEQELSYDEIAASLGRPVGTVKTWLHRARAELADLLTQRGVGC